MTEVVVAALAGVVVGALVVLMVIIDLRLRRGRRR